MIETRLQIHIDMERFIAFLPHLERAIEDGLLTMDEAGSLVFDHCCEVIECPR